MALALFLRHNNKAKSGDLSVLSAGRLQMLCESGLSFIKGCALIALRAVLVKIGLIIIILIIEYKQKIGSVSAVDTYRFKPLNAVLNQP